jgi:hypothetical protein
MYANTVVPFGSGYAGSPPFFSTSYDDDTLQTASIDFDQATSAENGE